MRIKPKHLYMVWTTTPGFQIPRHYQYESSCTWQRYGPAGKCVEIEFSAGPHRAATAVTSNYLPKALLDFTMTRDKK